MAIFFSTYYFIVRLNELSLTMLITNEKWSVRQEVTETLRVAMIIMKIAHARDY